MRYPPLMARGAAVIQDRKTGPARCRATEKHRLFFSGILVDAGDHGKRSRSMIATRISPAAIRGHNMIWRGELIRRFSAATLLAVSSVFTAASTAQEFPSKPVHIVVPFPAGGSFDSMSRLL